MFDDPFQEIAPRRNLSIPPQSLWGRVQSWAGCPSVAEKRHGFCSFSWIIFGSCQYSGDPILRICTGHGGRYDMTPRYLWLRGIQAPKTHTQKNRFSGGRTLFGRSDSQDMCRSWREVGHGTPIPVATWHPDLLKHKKRFSGGRTHWEFSFTLHVIKYRSSVYNQRVYNQGFITNKDIGPVEKPTPP